MKRSILFSVTFLTILLTTIGHPQAARAADFDHSKFDQILKTYVENTIMLSKLFDWFAGDFESKSGSVTNFIKPYLDEKAMAFLDRMPNKPYITYNRALNAKEPLK